VTDAPALAQIQTRFSLAGIRNATTVPQQNLIKHAVDILSTDDRVLAVYLVGGFALGTGDAWSDVDLQVTIRDDAKDEIADSWGDIVDVIAPTAYRQPFGGSTIGGLCITPEWLHFDIVFNPLSSFDPRSVEGMVPLVDKERVLPDHPTERPDRRRELFFPRSAVEHFLYMLGNCVSVIARNEPVPASNGVILVRDLDLVRLLLAERGLETTREHTFGNPFPFTKRLRPYLTDEQNSVLAQLPPVEATIDSVIDGYIALAQAFLPRARRLAEKTGDLWPAVYERASVHYFESSIGVELNV